ncbi:hypothetical protein CDD83_9241 [Cordyceps sp. RAO-2017]|nr:hypothetical protein CDD83_9241 [Cordyceps sp. RAO-2017]
MQLLAVAELRAEKPFVCSIPTRPVGRYPAPCPGYLARAEGEKGRFRAGTTYLDRNVRPLPSPLPQPPRPETRCKRRKKVSVSSVWACDDGDRGHNSRRRQAVWLETARYPLLPSQVVAAPKTAKVSRYLRRAARPSPLSASPGYRSWVPRPGQVPLPEPWPPAHRGRPVADTCEPGPADAVLQMPIRTRYLRPRLQQVHAALRMRPSLARYLACYPAVKPRCLAIDHEAASPPPASPHGPPSLARRRRRLGLGLRFSVPEDRDDELAGRPRPTRLPPPIAARPSAAACRPERAAADIPDAPPPLSSLPAPKPPLVGIDRPPPPPPEPCADIP